MAQFVTLVMDGTNGNSSTVKCKITADIGIGITSWVRGYALWQNQYGGNYSIGLTILFFNYADEPWVVSIEGKTADDFYVAAKGYLSAFLNSLNPYVNASVSGRNITLTKKDGTTTTITTQDTNTTYTSLKNPYALTLQANGSTTATYDGSSALTFNVTPSAIGAAPSSHNHNVMSNGNYKVQMQNDGNLVVYNGSTAIWDSKYWASKAFSLNGTTLTITL